MVAACQISPLACRTLCGHATGTVHSVFSSSFNVMLGGQLLHVGGAGTLLSCIGLTVPADALAQMLVALRPGDLVVARAGLLRLYDRAGVHELDARSAEVVECRLPAIGVDEPVSWALARLEALRPEGRCGLPLDARAVAHLGALSGPAPTAGELAQAVEYLVGRGQGLTPSGDDLLLGYAAACAAAGRDVSGLVRAMCDARDRTTDVSAAYFDAFAHGWVNPVYGELMVAAIRRDAAAFDRAAARILSIGHTSGADALVGMRLGFASTVRVGVPVPV